MRPAKFLIIALLLGVPAWLGAQATPPTAGAPEMFSATAQAKNATGAISGTVEVRVSRYTPDFDRTAVETALRLGGYPRFLTTLRNAPEVGQVVLAGSEPYAIRYAREKSDAGGRTIIVVTDKPVFFVGGGRTDPKAKPRAGYEVGVLQIQVDGTGRASGMMAGAARVRPDGDGVLLDDYAETPTG